MSELHLSLMPQTKLRVCTRFGGTTRLTEIENVGDEAYVYDFYGNLNKITVTKAEAPEAKYLLAATSGEPIMVGENHSVYCRGRDSAEYKRVPVSEINDVFYVRMPQKKIVPTPGLFEAMDIDDTGLFLETEHASNLLTLIEGASTLGIDTSRRRTERRIDLDKNRPTCFATKLLAGAFQVDPYETLASLAKGAVIVPTNMFSEEFVAETTLTGIIFEGNNPYNDVLCLQPRRVEKVSPVYHVKLSKPLMPVELAWFNT